MKLSCFQQVLLDSILELYGPADQTDIPLPSPVYQHRAAHLFRKTQRRSRILVRIGATVAACVSVLLILQFVLTLWILRDLHDPPPMTEPTSDTVATDPTTAPTEPVPTEPETVTVQLLTEERSYEADGTLLSVTTYTYDHRGLLLTYRTDYTNDPRPDASGSYSYDDHGYQVNDFLGGHTYDEEGRLIAGTANGRRYRMVYGQDGRLERVQMITAMEQLEDALVCEYEGDRLSYVFDLRSGSTPEICSFLYDDDGLPMYFPRWSRTLPEGYGDTVLVRQWPDIGEYELTYTDGVLSKIRHLAEAPSLEDTFELDGSGNTTRITKASGAYKEYSFRAMTLEAAWAQRLPRRDFRNEEAPIKCYPDQILRMIFP